MKWLKNQLKILQLKFSDEIQFKPFLLIRVVLGLVMSINAILIVSNTERFNACFAAYPIQFNLLDFIMPLSLDSMRALTYIKIIAGLFIAAGFLYRLSALTYFLISGYFLLVSSLYYQNHYYLICLLSFLCIFIPLNANYSLDAKIKPSIKKERLPYVYLWILQFQIAVMYFFGAVAKMNPDWFQGYPLKIWLARAEHFQDLSKFTLDFLAYLFSYGGLGLDLLVVPALLYSKTRYLAIFALLFFHVVNSILFPIGVFPYLAFTLTVMCFWPWARQSTQKNKKSTSQKSYPWLWAYVILQIITPLKPYLQGDANWKNRGHFFAWRMRLMERQLDIEFVVVDSVNHKTMNVNLNSPKPYLARAQYQLISKTPDNLVKTAKFIAQDYYHQYGVYPAVYLRSRQSINGRIPEPYSDLSFDLTKDQNYHFWRYPWMLESKNPLP